MPGISLAHATGVATVLTTNGRGLSVEELAGQMMQELFVVSADAPDHVKQQMQAYQARVQQLVEKYLRQAKRSARTDLVGLLQAAGHEAAAAALKG